MELLVLEIVRGFIRPIDAAPSAPQTHKAAAVLLMSRVNVKKMNNRELVQWYKRIVEHPGNYSMYTRLDAINEKEQRLKDGTLTTDQIKTYSNEN